MVQLSASIWVLLICLMTPGISCYYQEGEDPEQKPVYCFQCNSGVDPDCVNIHANDTSNYHYKPCLDNEKYKHPGGYSLTPFCRKIVQRIYVKENVERVIRKCGWISHPQLDCYKYRNEDHDETVCQCFTDGCNGSSSLRQYPLMMLLMVLMLLRRAVSRE